MFGLDATLIVPIVAALVVFTGYMAISSRFTKKSTVNEKIRRLVESGMETQQAQATATFEEEPSALADGLEALLKAVGVNTTKYRAELQMKLLQSGITSPDAVTFYVAAKKLGWLVGLLIAVLLMTGEGQGGLKLISLVLSFIFVIAGVWGADIFLKNRKDKRQKVLQKSYPDALDLILVCVESGLALDAALSRVCRELELAHPEITKEFNKTRMELTLLNDRERALHNLSERTDMLAFRALVSALLQSEKFGTSLTETLRVLSEDYRHTRLMAAENKAGKLPALMTIPMMLLLLPALMMVLMGPAMITLVGVWK